MYFKYLCALILGMSISTGISAHQTISPGSKQIKVQGRGDYSNYDRYRFDFPGVQFAMRFSNSQTIGAKIKSSAQSYFQVAIDGSFILDRQGKVAIFRSIKDTTIIFLNNLGKGMHEVVLFKRNENLDNTPSEFMGFVIDDKATLFDAALMQKQRRIEFLGNSITCAYGSESKSKDSKFTPETENNYLSYANLIARAFDADISIVAHSGRGVVRNYGDKNKISTLEPTIPLLYRQSLDSDTSSRWDFNKYIPNAVVINLGTNDYSTQPFPDKAIFVDAYLRLLKKVRDSYGKDVKIFCIAGPLIDEPCYSIVKEIVGIQQTLYNDSNVEFIGIPRSLLNISSDYGAAYHPGADGHKKMAQMIAPVISSALGWSYNRSEMDDIQGGQQFYSRE